MKLEEEVKAMNDKQLRIRVAGILGARDVDWNADHSALMTAYWPEHDEGRGEGWREIPDYPNDIAAAWKLVEVAREHGWWWSAVYKAGYTHTDASKPGHEAVFRDINGGLRDDAYCGDVLLPRAITMAFILAMDPS